MVMLYIRFSAPNGVYLSIPLLAYAKISTSTRLIHSILPARTMKTWVLILSLVLSLCSCTNDLQEPPLNLLPGAEPSAKSRNDRGIKHYQAGRYFDALLQFNQANFADPTSGEIHFNLGLAYLQDGNEKKAFKNFKQARKRARGNPKILKSVILNKLLASHQE